MSCHTSPPVAKQHLRLQYTIHSPFCCLLARLVSCMPCGVPFCISDSVCNSYKYSFQSRRQHQRPIPVNLSVGFVIEFLQQLLCLVRSNGVLLKAHKFQEFFPVGNASIPNMTHTLLSSLRRSKYEFGTVACQPCQKGCGIDMSIEWHVFKYL
jgi:hypothetical protein